MILICFHVYKKREGSICYIDDSDASAYIAKFRTVNMNGIKEMISSRLMYELQTNTMQLRGDYTVFCSKKYKKKVPA